ncbi:hypothetical protein ACA910_008263 [Epithemia clementina (nom. ined.)]
MAALNRPTTANYEVHENVVVDTQDHEDHTFCGILFPIKIKDDLPISKIILRSVAVRGRLGPMTVWISNEDAPTDPPVMNRNRGHRNGGEGDNNNNNNNDDDDTNNNSSRRSTFHFRLQRRHWTKIYEQMHQPSMREYQQLDFSDSPVILKPGTVRALYIHSKLPGDEAIVYDNTRHNFQPFGGGGHWGRRPAPVPRAPSAPRYQDDMIAIYTGKAHLSTTPFGQTNIWGWDNAWRDYREFVGQLHYGTVFQLWQPSLHKSFGTMFDQSARTLLALQRRRESPVSMLPDECIFYILNMCRWDWFDDKSSQLKAQRRMREARIRALEHQRQLEQEQREEQQLVLQRQQQQQMHGNREDSADANASVSGAAVAVVAAGSNPPHACTLASGAAGTSAPACASRQRHENQQGVSSSDDGTEFFDAKETPSDDHGAEGNAIRMDTSCSSRNPEQGHESNDNNDSDEDYQSSDDNDDMEEDQEENEEEDDGDEEFDEDEEEDDDDREEAALEEEDSDPDIVIEDDDVDDDDGDDDDDDEDDGWDRANGYRANPSFLTFRDASSDEEADNGENGNDEEAEVENRHAWFRRHFARIHILRALAQPENETDEDRVVLMRLD